MLKFTSFKFILIYYLEQGPDDGSESEDEQGYNLEDVSSDVELNPEDLDQLEGDSL